MNKKIYVMPQTEVVVLRLANTVLGDDDLDDLFGGASEDNEDSHTDWATAKDGGLFDDFEPFGSLWDDAPAEDPFSIGD